MPVFASIARRFIVPASTKSDGLRLAFDLEADGLLDTATKLHCIVIADLDSDEINEYGPEQIKAALEHLARADYLVGHNITGYDLALLAQFHGWQPKPGCAILDTLVAARLILPNIADLDDQAAGMGDPPLGALRGRYSLEAWGARLRIPKAGVDIVDWSQWTSEMQERCVGDVVLCKILWRLLCPDGYAPQAVELEHRTAVVCDKITAAGVPFDTEVAERLRQQWTARRAELAAKLLEQFPGTNLNSRTQIGALLEARGWVPEERTEKTNQPRISDEVLEAIPALYPEFTGLAEHYILGRRLGQLVNGAQAWCKNVGADGRIHGGLVHIGTPHSRAKHLNPNLAQVPNPKKGKAFASECRALFRAPPGWVCVTCDQAGLQDRGYAHYLHDFDGGAYARTFADDGVDTHWRTAAALGLVADGTERDKQDKVHAALREGAKTFRYAFLYGAGAKRAGEIINNTVRAAQQLDSTNDLPQRFFGGVAHPSEAALKRVGGQALDKFISATPGLSQLRLSLEKQARRHEWLVALDSRRVPVRALYSALNFIVTSSEAIICKRWLVGVHDELCARFHYGWDGDVVIALWIHDELVCFCRPAIASEVGEAMVRHAKEAGAHYGFKVPLDAAYTIGLSWAGEPVEVDAEPVEVKAKADPVKADPIEVMPESAPAAPDAGDGPGAGDGSRDGPGDGPGSAGDGPGDGAGDGAEGGEDVAGNGEASDDGAGEGLGDDGDGGEALNDAGDVGDGSEEGDEDPGDAGDVDIGGAELDHGADAGGGALASLPGAPADASNPTGPIPTPAFGTAIPGPGAAAGNGAGARGNGHAADGKFHCPFHDDDTPSLQVYPDHYHCFGCGAHGPLSDLPPDWAEAAAAGPSTDEAARLAYAHMLWDAAQPIAGTLAARYLAEIRGIDLGALPPDIDKALRFHSACPFNSGWHACLLALFRDVATDEPAGIHRIALTPGAQKIDRRMLGRWPRPRAIKLWPLIRLEAAAKPLYLGEGTETTLAAATRLKDRGRPMWPAWAAGSSGNIKKFPIVPGVEELILLVDRDPSGEDAVAVCRQTWKAGGRRVRRLRTQDAELNDFNDLIRAKLRAVS